MDPIKYIFENPALTGRIDRWQMLLSEYDIEYHTLKSIKGSVLADHLAHQPIDDYESINFEFPNEDVMYLKAKDCHEPLPNERPDPGSHWGLIFDGAVNVYGNEEAIDLRIKNLDVYGDSNLVVNQVTREWETRQPDLIPYKDYVRRLSTFFNKTKE
ncbi:uncharacterized protein LOC127129848 [Lathyrus oleraceus]|uniref:uncharacterized protein LOC127129848 n=1 Tax=Pisum sativum TaxID=3888 RepID=UPI0021D0BD1C|nr:uncharacterized protein LOC127129848 [Pisum sativum]